MDNRLIWSEFVMGLATIGLMVTNSPWVGIAMWLIILASSSYATEITIALYDVRVWYNVMVVSALSAMPQAISAVALALGGNVGAAWIDTILSTVVDAVFVTALVRPYAPGSPYIRRLLPSLIMWSAAALTVDLYARSGIQSAFISTMLVAAGYVALPALIVLNLGEVVGGRPPLSVIATALLNTIGMAYGTYYLIQDIYALTATEVGLGLTSAFLTALPDLVAALMIRAIYARVVGSESDAEAVATMLASAVHDQVSVPAVILLLVAGAGSTYPSLLNLFAIAVKFTLLSRRYYYLVGLPASLALVIFLGLGHAHV